MTKRKKADEKNICRINKKTGKIQISTWYDGGFLIVRRDGLSAEHKESWYGCLKRLGLTPEDYGYYKTCPCCGRKEEMPDEA